MDRVQFAEYNGYRNGNDKVNGNELNENSITISMFCLQFEAYTWNGIK